MSGEREETQEVLEVPVTHNPKSILLGRRWATGHIGGQSYTIDIGLDARHMSVTMDNGEEWRIDIADVAAALCKKLNDQAAEADKCKS